MSEVIFTSGVRMMISVLAMGLIVDLLSLAEEVAELFTNQSTAENVK